MVREIMHCEIAKFVSDATSGEGRNRQADANKFGEKRAETKKLVAKQTRITLLAFAFSCYFWLLSIYLQLYIEQVGWLIYQNWVPQRSKTSR